MISFEIYTCILYISDSNGVLSTFLSNSVKVIQFLLYIDQLYEKNWTYNDFETNKTEGHSHTTFNPLLVWEI